MRTERIHADMKEDDRQPQHLDSGSLSLQQSSQAPTGVSGPTAAGGNATAATATAVALRNSSSIGLMLLGSVAFIMTMFYGVHFPDPGMQHATWSALSQITCMLCAILIFKAFKAVMVEQFGESGGQAGATPGLPSLCISLVRLFLLFWLVQTCLMRYRERPLPLIGCVRIGGIILAFAAIDAFGLLQQFAPFSNSPGQAFLALVVAAVMYGCMCWSASIVRVYWVTYEDGIMKEAELKWHEACRQVENNGAGICLGLLLSSIIRFTISGKLPPVDGSPSYKTNQQILYLMGVCLGFTLPIMALTATGMAMEKQRGKIPAVLRGLDVLTETMTMTMGWSLVFLGQWELWSSTDGPNPGFGIADKMSARMTCALLASFVGFILLYLVDWVADRMKSARAGFESITRAIILGIAVSWEGVFARSVEAISHEWDDATSRCYVDVALSIFICAVVVPAWVMYMLPKDLAGPVPVRGKENDQKVQGSKDGEENDEPGTDYDERGEETGEAKASEELGSAAGGERGQAQTAEDPLSIPTAERPEDVRPPFRLSVGGKGA